MALHSEEKQSIETVLKSAQILDLIKEIKLPILNMFRIMETISKEPLENMRMISQQIKHNNKDTEIM